ncbi:MAG: LVIVD repeat-containing protein [bacterium]
MNHSLPLLLLTMFLLTFSCSGDDDDVSPSLQRLSNLPLSGGLTDVWGYVDSAGKEYAIVGFGGFTAGGSPNSGFYIIDVSNPRSPEQVAKLTTVPGFDVKVWQHYVYAVDGGGVGQGGIVDISDVRNPRRVGEFASSHNIFIAENGLMYLQTQNQPLRILDLNPDPVNPSLVWKGGNDGHDAAVIGQRLYDFGAFGSTNIFDVSNPANPVLLAAIDSPTISFHHSGWPTEDARFLFICDELADLNGRPSDFTVWDISDVDNPEQVGGFADADATVHNLYVIGQFAYVSYYHAGLRIFDVSNPSAPTIAQEFDTSTGRGSGFGGAFGVYPFAPSGTIYVSDTQSGLHVFSFAGRGLNSSSSPIAP